jgi:3-deoxy-D-manno-octulosonate 8-phosphate phosphatase KdsC-like HAD superfamily phosphatase
MSSKGKKPRSTTKIIYMKDNQITLTILQAMGYNLAPSVVDAVIAAYELAKKNGGETSIENILELKNNLIK